jgi:hypothetical protein
MDMYKLGEHQVLYKGANTPVDFISGGQVHGCTYKWISALKLMGSTLGNSLTMVCYIYYVTGYEKRDHLIRAKHDFFYHFQTVTIHLLE